MIRVLLAGPDEAVLERLHRLFSSGGIRVFRLCRTGSELRQALSGCEAALAVFAGPLRSCAPDEVTGDFPGRVRLLLLGSERTLPATPSPSTLRLQLPASGRAALAAAEDLLRAPAPQGRAQEERRVILEAKQLLMAREGLTEAEAHRRLQRRAMNGGLKLADCAALILKGDERNRR